MQTTDEANALSDLDSRLAKLLVTVLECDDELLQYFAASRYSLLFVMKLLLECEEKAGLSKEECLVPARYAGGSKQRQRHAFV